MSYAPMGLQKTDDSDEGPHGVSVKSSLPSEYPPPRCLVHEGLRPNRLVTSQNLRTYHDKSEPPKDLTRQKENSSDDKEDSVTRIT